MKAFLSTFCLSAFLLLLNGCPACVYGVNRQIDTSIKPNEERIFVLNQQENSLQQDGVWNLDNVDVSNVSKTRKLIAFTFDDAPVSGFENLIAVFADYNAQNPDCIASATVFYNGIYLRSNPVGAQAALTVGFEYANHSNNHLDLSTLDDQEVLREIDEVDKLLFPYDGKRTHLFRPPYGKIKNGTKPLVNAPIINWSIDTLDWTGKTADEIFSAVFDNRQSGAIVLMHDGFDYTIQAVKRLLPALKEAGYQVVSLSQMAKVNQVSFKYGSTYARARKASER